MSNQFWDANSVAGSGEMWSTANTRTTHATQERWNFNRAPRDRSLHIELLESVQNPRDLWEQEFSQQIIYTDPLPIPPAPTRHSSVEMKNMQDRYAFDNVFSWKYNDELEEAQETLNKEVHDMIKSKMGT